MHRPVYLRGGVYRTLEQLRLDTGLLRCGELVKVEQIRPVSSERLRLQLSVQSGRLRGRTGWCQLSREVRRAALDVQDHLEFQPPDKCHLLK